MTSRAIHLRPSKYTKYRVIVNFIVLFWLLFLSYFYMIAPLFSYAGFGIWDFSATSLLGGFFLVILITGLGATIKDFLYYMLFHCILTMNFIPAVILAICMGWKLAPVLIVLFPLFTLFFLDKFTPKIEISPKKIIFEKRKAIKWTIIALILVTPLLSRYQYIDLSNLLLKEVYESRALAKSLDNPYIGYVANPLERYLLPFLLIYFMSNKKKIGTVIVLVMIIVVYLTTGSLKGYLVYTALMVLLFFGDSQFKKMGNFLAWLCVGLSLELFMFLVTGKMYITTYIRRSFFVEGLLSRQYAEYFSGNLTFFSHTKIASIFGVDSVYRSSGNITNWFGINVIGTGTNASIGSFTEGYFSLGIIGVIITCIIFGLVCFLVRSCEIENKYIGVVMLGCYVFIMSMIEMAFLTQGLWFFIVLCLYVFPRNVSIKS